MTIQSKECAGIAVENVWTPDAAISNAGTKRRLEATKDQALKRRAIGS